MMLGGVVYYQGEQTQQDDLDLQAVSSDFGFELDYAPDTITPRLIYENILLSREKYFDAFGASVDWNRDLSNAWGDLRVCPGEVSDVPEHHEQHDGDPTQWA